MSTFIFVVEVFRESSSMLIEKNDLSVVLCFGTFTIFFYKHSI